MPRPRPPHLHRETTRHGTTVWYVRKGQGPRIRIRAAFGTPEFEAEYQAALVGAPRQKRGEPEAGTLAWLLARYRETTDWSALSPATRRQRDNIFVHVLDKSGHHPASKVTTEHILNGKERRAATPAQARNFLDAMRGLFRWAKKARLVKVDPTAGVDNPPRKAGEGFVAWTEDDVAAFEAHWPIGTRQRVWLDVLLYSGLRRGDAVRLGRQHVREGVASLKTEKSGGTVEVMLPVLDVLQATLDAGPCGDLTFIVGANGRPLTKESFGNEFAAAARSAGIVKSAHGVRKIAATRAANAGATVAQLEAIFGWTGGTMASLYTRKADRKRLAKAAMHLLANDAGTSIPAPLHPVREKGEKG
ncbi:tyrosine-type recombinase/integrase [Ancylobacter sp. 6x-1]|uniref:Tyrosine-type recombinase/integrase n=1 Tax=Ancylobacter crimeensis TaxID=2579147 RepID=A0ABT0DC77_9HYPH|nr:tyrosine-type recombinase/integrase [Ancylobacter crimeensis]MCK0197565.1 tyrosine-type recombinase/integrase [Ancylobacter crimeensis]